MATYDPSQIELRVRFLAPDLAVYSVKGGIISTAANTMSSLLTDLGTVVTQMLSWVGDVVTTIVSNPYLLLTTGVLVLGAAVGILGRLLSRN